MITIDHYLNEKKNLIESWLVKLLPKADTYPQSIHQAMHYTLFAGGKRIRPILAIACSESLGYDIEKVLPSACALELIHTYSLIHDDLPAMDNDDMRRGKPSNHKVFGEAIAILAGDALLTYAFYIVSNSHGLKRLSPDISLKIIQELSHASGICGMISGQVLDLEAEGKSINEKNLQNIHQYKTAQLFRAATRIGSIPATTEEEKIEQLSSYGYLLGLAFQIIDDLHDSAQESDKGNKKATYPSVVGIEFAEKRSTELIDQAVCALDSFDSRADILRELAQYIITRKN
ncbi:MAG: polyprenyl synthetase family protein [bacterium]